VIIRKHRINVPNTLSEILLVEILEDAINKFPNVAWHDLMTAPKAARTFGMKGPIPCPSKTASPLVEPQLLWRASEGKAAEEGDLDIGDPQKDDVAEECKSSTPNVSDPYR
jgi:hypothetical protein